jgi:biotin operon repressor
MTQKPKQQTIIKLQERKVTTRDYVMRDTDTSLPARVCLWFMLDCITLDRTALEYEAKHWVTINPTQQTIADSMGVSRKRVNEAVQELIERGYLRQVKRGSGLSGSSEYQVLTLKKIKERHAAK